MRKLFLASVSILLLAGIGATAAHFLIPGGILRYVAGPFAREPYTCPMAEHWQVRSDQPGRCPLCGMNLMPLSRTEHKGKSPPDPRRGMGAGAHAEPSGHAGSGQGEHSGHAEMKPEKSPGASDGKAGAQAVAKPAGPGGSPETYYCPMHPSYQADRPGDCPICNMSLVPLKGGEAPMASKIPGYSVVTIRPERRQLIGLKTGAVEKKVIAKTIRAVCRVEYNEKKLSAVNLKYGGWIEELKVKATGESVRKGDPLFVIYSPELLEAQQSYLLALEAFHALGSNPAQDARAFAEQSLRSARDRLLLWDLAEEQIRSLEARKEPAPRMPVLSRMEGVVIKRNVVQGTYVEPGKDLYEIADLSTVWVHADVYEYEIPEVKEGLKAQVHLSALPNQPLSGEVVYVYPYLNEATRTVRVRLEFPNPEGKLKPGAYGNVAIAVDLGERIVVDDQAILDSGSRQIVFMDQGEGRIEPREVKVAARADGLAVIAEGLEAGEKVVTSGNFLVDAESRLKAALLQGASGGGHKH
ncbi:MAG: efflux RND transporter periplasmic adaptor subunit [Planctomycetes bacterium]|nr:efflux RND transporter periplasmic adaptor subunit [Planctomycetota bacterium]